MAQLKNLAANLKGKLGKVLDEMSTASQTAKLQQLRDEASTVLGKGTRYKSTAVGQYADGSYGVASSDTLVLRAQREWAEERGVRIVNGEGHAELTLRNGATDGAGPLVHFEIDSPHGRNAANPNGQMCKDCAVDATSGGATTSATSSGRSSRKRL